MSSIVLTYMYNNNNVNLASTTERTTWDTIDWKDDTHHVTDDDRNNGGDDVNDIYIDDDDDIGGGEGWYY